MQVSGPQKGTIVPIGIYEVGYKGVDIAGNEGFCNFRVFVLDELPPTLAQPCMAPIIVNLTEGCCVVVNWTNPSANTNCDSALNFTYTPPQNTCFPIGTTVVTLIVDDIVDRSAQCSFTVTVNDQRPAADTQICVPPQDVELPCGPAFQYYQQNVGLARYTNGCPAVGIPNRTAMFCGASPIEECFSWGLTSPSSNIGTTTTEGCFSTSDGSCQCSFLLGLNVTVNATNATFLVWGEDVNAGVCNTFVLGTPPYTFTFTSLTTNNVTTVVSNSPSVTVGPLSASYYGLVVKDARGLTATACFQIIDLQQK
jgi:hypothetical protein